MNIRTGLFKLVPEPMPGFNRAHLQEEKPWGTTTQATAVVASWDWTCLHPRQSLTDPQSSALASNHPFIFPGCRPCRLSSTHLLPCRKLPALDLVSHLPALWGHPSYPMAVDASSHTTELYRFCLGTKAIHPLFLCPALISVLRKWETGHANGKNESWASITVSNDTWGKHKAHLDSLVAPGKY